jgi:O-antigen ligase
MRQTDTGLFLETTRPSTFPKKVIYILVRARTSPKIVRWTFLLFVSTFPFEAIDLEALRGVASLTRVVGLLFFSTCLLYPKVCFRRPPQALWWFAGYVSIYVLNGLFIPEQHVGPFMEQLQTLIQLLALFWIGSTLLQEEKFTRHTFLAFSIATLLPAAGMLLGLPGFSKTLTGGRLSFEGFDPNRFALIMSLGAQALIGFGIEQTPRNIWMRVTFMAMSLFPLAATIYTGSRGGIIACVTGVALYALPYSRSKRKMLAILGATIAAVSVVYIVVNDQSTLSRLEMSYDTGDTAGRDKLFTVSLEMFSEKPLLGWRPIVFYYELGQREGKGYAHKGRDAHNLFLHLLLEVGLLGAAPFLIGLGLCMRAAWIARVRSLGLLPLVWLTTMLVGSMALSSLRYKSLWLVLTLSLASGASTVKQFKRKNLMLRAILQYPHRRNMNYGLDL